MHAEYDTSHSSAVELTGEGGLPIDLLMESGTIVFVLKKISTPFTVYINRYIIIKRISNLAESNARELLCGVEQNDD